MLFLAYSISKLTMVSIGKVCQPANVWLIVVQKLFFWLLFRKGRMHDARMLDTSGLYVDLAQFAFSPAGQEMCIYGDPAYPLRTHLQCPFRNGVLTRQMEEFNASMSSVRTSVEWLFGDLINYFKFLDYKKNLKIGLSHVGKMYIVCALLRNALTCFYRSTTADFFGLDPPSLVDYFS